MITDNVMYDNYVYLHGLLYKIQDFQDCEVCDPIPIDKQWLNDFGFRYDRILKVWTHDKSNIILIELLNGGLGMLVMNLQHVPFNHVHQLQNLYYCLYQTELTINKKPH